MGEFRDKNKSVMVGDGVNWDATSHQQLWEWFSQPRLQELQAWTDTFNDTVVAHFQTAADKVDQALKAAGVAWEGAAADAMQDATSPLAEHALRAKDAATQTGFGTMGQFLAAKEIALALPEPAPAPDQNIFIAAQDGNLAQHFQDVAAYEQAANEAEARARDLARAYDGAADRGVESLPRFEPAPVATVSRAEPKDVIEIGEPQPRDSGPREDTGPADPRPGDPGTGDPGQVGGPGSTPGPGSVTPSPGDQPSRATAGQSSTSGGHDLARAHTVRHRGHSAAEHHRAGHRLRVRRSGRSRHRRSRHRHARARCGRSAGRPR